MKCPFCSSKRVRVIKREEGKVKYICNTCSKAFDAKDGK